MCGRASFCRLTAADVAAVTGSSQSLPPGVQPRVNAGPGTTWPLFIAAGPTRIAVSAALWGVPRPAGRGTPGALLINARSETAAATPTWARLLARGAAARAVVAVRGWFEWKRGSRQPYFVYGSDGDPKKGDGETKAAPFPLIALAALVDTSTSPPRFVILTTAPPSCLAWLHDRAPAVLGPACPTNAAVRGWLDARTPPAGLAPYGGPLAWHPVTPDVGSVSYQEDDATADVRSRKGGLAAAWAKVTPKKESGGEKPEPSSPPPPPIAVKAEPKTDAKPGKKRGAAGQASLDGFVKRRAA